MKNRIIRDIKNLFKKEEEDYYKPVRLQSLSKTTCVVLCYGFAALYKGRGGIFKINFKILIILYFVTDCLKFTKKKKKKKTKKAKFHT